MTVLAFDAQPFSPSGETGPQRRIATPPATPPVFPGTPMERALDPQVLIGMPQLTPFGLSESWLMKELGHRHWLLLARRLGMADADFRTPDGAAAYAAICATALKGADLGAVAANDVLSIRSDLRPLSRAQAASRHRLTLRGRPVGEVELVSAFVQRVGGGDNHALARVGLPGQDVRAAPEENALAATASALRHGRAPRHLELLAQGDTGKTFAFTPDPVEDFNGAGLFYFAGFQALAGRAVRRWFPDTAGRAVRRRDVFFAGNIRPGETVGVTCTDRRDDGVACRLARPDGQVIGRVFTLFAPA
ncbi:Pnap_2097 family protein [Ensifer soli]|uniref:Pnap_2097 family protein n=1 Tax=Ciceribacter sp. sgz301302 TaxID=3342379 RepID=UPI0035BB2342